MNICKETLSTCTTKTACQRDLYLYYLGVAGNQYSSTLSFQYFTCTQCGTPSVRKRKPHANLLKARSRVSFGSFFVGLGMFVRGGTASVMAVNIT